MSTFEFKSIIFSLLLHGVGVLLLFIGIYGTELSSNYAVGRNKGPVDESVNETIEVHIGANAVPAAPSAKAVSTVSRSGESVGSGLMRGHGTSDHAERGGSTNSQELTVKAAYLAELRVLIEKNKEYPSMARTLRQQGTVSVRFQVNQHGLVSLVGLVKTSGFGSLDEAALALVKNLEQVPPFPRELLEDALTVVVPISFVL